MSSPVHIDNVARIEENDALDPQVLRSQSLVHDAEYDSDTPPTADEWKTMKGYGSFITYDEENLEHVFAINNVIYVLPTGRDPDEEVETDDMWLAQIRSIRAHDSDSVWIKAKWFYHPSELPKNVKGMTGKTKHFGKHERISSNQADFIPTSTCCGIANIVQYDEQNLEQEAIEPGAFYYRSDYDWQKRALKSAAPPCSICKKPYNPDSDTMHFCPRPGCCRSWHTTCLASANWLIRSPANLLQRLESLDADWTPSATTTADCGPKKKARAEPALTSLSSHDPHSRVPLGLLAVARQPIARGGALGVVGNVRSVVRARKMLREALRGNEEVPEDWEVRLGEVFNADAIEPCKESGKGKGKGKGRALAYQCPRCGEPI